MWTSSCRVLQELLSRSAVRRFSVTPAQQTVVVERWWQVPLSKEGSPPRLHPRRHRIYKLVEDTKNAPKEKMELILTQSVPRVGEQGRTVLVKKSFGRNKLLAKGLAVYASPENKKKFSAEIQHSLPGVESEDGVLTFTAKLTVDFLKRSKLMIRKMPSDEFQLNSEVISRQFLKKLGVFVPPHALKLSEEPIKELGDYWCEVTVNGIETVRVPMSLLPYEDPSAAYKRMMRAKMRQQAALDASEAAGEEEDVMKAAPEGAANFDADSVSAVPEASASEATEASASEATEASASEATEASASEATEASASEATDASASEATDASASEATDASASEATDASASEATEASASEATEASASEATEASASEATEASASEASAEASETAATQTSQGQTAPPSDKQKKD
ncbi:large ribosomal subunit protein bL9m [Aulostomus maculatus]